MCEILLCVKNMGNTGNLSWDSHQPQIGDVVVAKDDGASWAAAELGFQVQDNPWGNHPHWRLLKLPNVTLTQASRMLSAEVDTDPTNPSPYLQYRGFFLDKSKILPATMQALITYWQDDGRTQGFITLNYTAAQVNSIVTQRTPIAF